MHTSAYRCLAIMVLIKLVDQYAHKCAYTCNNCAQISSANLSAQSCALFIKKQSKINSFHFDPFLLTITHGFVIKMNHIHLSHSFSFT